MRTLYLAPAILIAIFNAPVSMTTIQDPAPDRQSESAGNIVIANNEIVISPNALLGDVIDKLAPFAQKTILMKKDAAAKIGSIRIGLSSPIRTSKTAASEVLDLLLYSNEFVLVPPGKTEGLPWELKDLKGPDRNTLRAQATMIDVKEIERYSNKVVLCSVIIPLDHANAREISASLRPFFPDNQLETVSNIGNSNCLLVYGFGPTVAAIYRLLQKIDAESAESAAVAAERKAAEQAVHEKSVQGLAERIAVLEKEISNMKKKDGDGK
ncbi:MAG: hypothetical protein ACKVS6_15540 [Planctomycetota bacterium]